MCSVCLPWAPGIPHLPIVPAPGKGMERDMVGTGWNWGAGWVIPVPGDSVQWDPCIPVGSQHRAGLGRMVPTHGWGDPWGELRAGGDSHAWVGLAWMYPCSLRVGNLDGRIPTSGRSE